MKGVQHVMILVGSVHRGHFVTDSHLWLSPGLVVVQREQGHVEFLGSTIYPPHKVAESWFALCIGLHDSYVKLSAKDFMFESAMGHSDAKRLKRVGEMTIFSPAPSH